LSAPLLQITCFERILSIFDLLPVLLVSTIKISMSQSPLVSNDSFLSVNQTFIRLVVSKPRLGNNIEYVFTFTQFDSIHVNPPLLFNLDYYLYYYDY